MKSLPAMLLVTLALFAMVLVIARATGGGAPTFSDRSSANYTTRQEEGGFVPGGAAITALKATRAFNEGSDHSGTAIRGRRSSFGAESPSDTSAKHADRPARHALEKGDARGGIAGVAVHEQDRVREIVESTRSSDVSGMPLLWPVILLVASGLIVREMLW